jgi:hypothetical protein
MAKIPELPIKVITPGSIKPEDVLRGTCDICGCVAETRRDNTLLMRAARSENNVLRLGIECPTKECTNWIVMAKIADQ